MIHYSCFSDLGFIRSCHQDPSEVKNARSKQLMKALPYCWPTPNPALTQSIAKPVCSIPSSSQVDSQKKPRPLWKLRELLHFTHSDEPETCHRVELHLYFLNFRRLPSLIVTRRANTWIIRSTQQAQLQVVFSTCNRRLKALLDAGSMFLSLLPFS
jgi:hypothetical protein